MKILTAFLILSLITPTIKSQVNWGIKGGLNLANISNAEGSKTLSTFHVGGTISFKINDHIAIQPELLFTGKGFKTNYISMTNSSVQGIINPFYIETPLLLVIKSNDLNGIKVFGAIGPYCGIGIAAKMQATVDGNILRDDIKWWNDKELKRIDTGITLNTGIEIRHVILSIYYDLGLNHTNPESLNSNRVFGVSLGYLFK